MNREQLAHVLRAAAQLVDPDIVVVGSQAILGSFSEDELPADVMLSMEADLAFPSDDDETKSDEIDGLIGEDSQFHADYAYYAQGVSLSQTVTLPDGWQTRVVAYERPDAAPSRAVCVEPHDLVVSKLVAGRDKDVEFATLLIRAGLVEPALLHERAALLPTVGGVVRRVQDAISRCTRAAGS